MAASRLQQKEEKEDSPRCQVQHCSQYSTRSPLGPAFIWHETASGRVFHVPRAKSHHQVKYSNSESFNNLCFRYEGEIEIESIAEWALAKTKKKFYNEHDEL